jgi:tetratricopeptide (TPR) repeat protein
MRLMTAIGLVAMMLTGVVCSAQAADCAPREAIEAYESGKAHLESGRLEKGISEIERAVAVYPDFGDAWYDLYESYKRADRPNDAIAALEQLVRIHPGKHSGAQIWRELLALHKAEARIPPAALKALNKCRQHKVGSKRAIAACEKALSLHPDYSAARYFLGVNHIYAGDEESAKDQLETLIERDPPMAGMLAHTMEVVTDWLTEDYMKELQAKSAAAGPATEPETSAEVAPAEFSAEDIARILGAYEKQIEALQSLIADPGPLPETCKRRAPTESMTRLAEELRPLSFVRVEMSQRPECRHALGYVLLDVRDASDRQSGRTEVVKVSKDLEVGERTRERWRIGLHQEWLAEPYCQAECTARLQVRIDRETEGQVVTFNAWIEVLEEIADIVRCSSHHGEMPSAQEW